MESTCWNNVLNKVVNQDDPEDEIHLSNLRQKLQINLIDLEESAARFLSEFVFPANIL